MPITLPLGVEAQIRGMTGREEDLLTDQKKARSGEAINEVLANCTVSLTLPEGYIKGEPAKTITKVQTGDIRRLKGPDRLALLLAIRIESFGPDMAVELKDPGADGEKFIANIDLSTLERKACGKEGAAIDIGPYDITLSDGTRVTVQHLDGKSEQAVAKATPGKELTTAMFYRIVEVENLHANDIKKWLEDLPIRRRTELRQKMAETDCGIDTSVQVTAPSGAEFKIDVQEQLSFFFPTTA